LENADYLKTKWGENQNNNPCGFESTRGRIKYLEALFYFLLKGLESLFKYWNVFFLLYT